MATPVQRISQGKSGSVIPIILVIVGLALLFGDFSLFNVGSLVGFVSRFWPEVFIIIGVVTLFRGRNRNFHRALLYIVGGILLQLLFLGWMPFDVETMWPLLFVLFGLYLLSTARRRKGGRDEQKVTVDRLSIVMFLDGKSVDVESGALYGGTVSCRISSLGLDLTHCATEVLDMELKISAFASGIALRVPEDWRVESHLTTQFSAIHDRRHVDPIEFGKDSPTLHLRGRLMLSRLELQD